MKGSPDGERVGRGVERISPAVLLGLSHSSLAVGRSLGRRGIPVYGIDRSDTRIGMKSRYIKSLRAPASDRRLLSFLLELGARFDSGAVLYLLDDEFVVFAAQHADELRRCFRFPCPNERLLERLVPKESMATILGNMGIAIPRTVVLNNHSGGELARLGLRFPVLLKPNCHERWLGNHEVGRIIGTRKVLVVDDHASLEQYYRVLRKYDTIIAQEFVPGKTDTLYYYLGYRNARGVMLASFVGRKLRTFPDTTGSECFSQSIEDRGLCRLGEEVLEKLGYVGAAGIDIKYDARDGGYKVIEVNCRLGSSDGLPVACGVDVPYIYYQDVRGVEVEPALVYERNVYWLWLEKDMEWFREYKTRDGYTKAKWWRHWLTHGYAYAVYARDDLMPFLWVSWMVLRRFLKAMAAKKRAGMLSRWLLLTIGVTVGN